MSDAFDHPVLGGLFGDPETAAIWSPERQVHDFIAFEIALTRALGHVGTVSPDAARAVAAILAEFRPDPGDLRRGTARDGVPVPALVAQLKTAAGGRENAIHDGATSQDVMDTALALALRDFNAVLDLRLARCGEALDRLSKRFGACLLMGRTRMQAALPIRVADRLAAWSAPLRRHAERLDALRPRIEVLQLGGAVGDCAALAPHAQAIAAHMARDLGLTNPPRSWHTMRDGLAEYANLLSMISATLGKMGQDVCLMAQQGIDEIALSGGGGSSAMAHKQNPVLAELLVTLARFNATQVSGLHHAMVHEQERSGAAWMLEWMILPQMARATARSLAAATDLCTRIERLGAPPGAGT